MGFGEEVRALERLARSEDEETRAYAAHELGWRTAPGALPVLFRLLCDECSLVRKAAAGALLFFARTENEAAVVRELVEVLVDPDPLVRHAAAHSLEMCGDWGALRDLLDDLGHTERGDESELIDAALPKACSEMGLALPPLEDPWVRLKAVLGEILARQSHTRPSADE